VRLVLRPLPDPAGQQFLLLGRERLLQRRRRHDLVGIFREDPVEGDAGIRITGGDRSRLDGGIPQVQPQIGLPAGAVGAVAGEAVLHQDRANVLVEGDRLGRGGQAGDQRQGGESPGTEMRE
jgi:hypothetical protein